MEFWKLYSKVLPVVLGILVLACTAFIGLVWLIEHVIHPFFLSIAGVEGSVLIWLGVAVFIVGGIIAAGVTVERR